MPKVALIEDGTELARQSFAAVDETFAACRQLLEADGYTQFDFHVFTDEEVDFVLDDVSREEWACLVFASNALRSDEVATAVAKRSRDVHRYIAAGGGIVVLHQVLPTLAPLLPAALLPDIAERATVAGQGRVIGCHDGDDVLLHFPASVDWSSLRDLGTDELRDLRATSRSSELTRQYFMAYAAASLPTKFRPVLMSPDDEVILTRTFDHAAERIVLSTMPLDWQGRRPGQATATTALLANAIRFAALGTMRRLVWRNPVNTRNELLRRWLSLDGAAAIRDAPATDAALDAQDGWMLRNVDETFVPLDQLDDHAARPEVDEFLRRGGTVLAGGPNERGAGTRVVALVGDHERRLLTARLFTELRAVPGWQTLDSAFALRSIVAVLAMLDGDPTCRSHPAAIAPGSLGVLCPPIIARLRDPNHREDFGSSLALAQTLAFLTAPAPVAGDDVAWLADDGRHREADVALQTSATTALLARQPHATLLADAVGVLQPQVASLQSLGSVVRILDSLALLHESALLVHTPDDATTLAQIIDELLTRMPPEHERGWLSVEATATVVRGLIAIDAALPDRHGDVATRLATHVATGVAALQRSRSRYAPSSKGVAWLAGLTHALLAAELRYPLGMQRLATLDWPDTTQRVHSAAEAESLIERLAVENEQQRRTTDELRGAVDVTTEQLAAEHRAAQIGRATATLVPVVILTAAAVLIVRWIGWASVPGLLANVTVLLSVALALLGAAFGFLDRRHLLAGPAQRVRAWLEKSASPVVGSVAKLKRQ